MNYKDWVGKQVVCIDPTEYVSFSGVFPQLKKGNVYTVKSVAYIFGEVYAGIKEFEGFGYPISRFKLHPPKYLPLEDYL